MTSEDILKELDNMNQEIERLISKRTEFIYSHINEVAAEFYIGQECINLRTHEFVTVTALYTSSSVGKGKGGYHDNSLSDIHARFSNGDNTSRYGIIHPYISKEDFDKNSDKYISKLEFLAMTGR